jgi:ribosomal protein S18 acetylase RimI-like enzyme|tara:strand:+ start:371 stop:877 length:507 start_codon:yes stop_codon:yes gene_type:complete
MKIDLRTINKDDEELIWKIVYVTADMEKTGETIEEAKKNADRRRYVCEWGKPFDYGIIAETSDSDRGLVGVAWMRLLTFDNKGAGYVDDQTPELSIGLFKEYRNRGIGKKMMIKLIDDVRGKVDKICLSVRDYNTPAISLYETFGFGIHGTPFKNRAGTMTHKMLLKL